MDSGVNLGDCISMQVMLLDSSLQLPSSVLVIPSPSDALLLGTRVGSPLGEWVGALSVTCFTDQIPPLSVGQVIALQLDLVLGLEQVLPSHQH